MEVAFPPDVRIRNIRLRPEGMRLAPFTNIDGETFARPTLNGFWRVSMTLMAATQDEFLSLTAFLAAMRGHARTVLPLTTRWLPNDGTGRQLQGFPFARGVDTVFPASVGEPFDGFGLRAPAAHRDSYIDVNTPRLSRLRPGHRVTLGNRLHQVVKVSAIDELETAARVSVLPSIRGNHAGGSTVVVDHLRLLAQLESADDPEDANLPVTEVSATFIEAF